MTALTSRGCCRSPWTHLAQWLIPDLRGLSDPVGFLNKIRASTCFPRQCPRLFAVGLPKNFKAKQHTKKTKHICFQALVLLSPPGSVLPVPGGSCPALGWVRPGGGFAVCREAAGPGRSDGGCLDYDFPAALSAKINVCRKLAVSRGLVGDPPLPQLSLPPSSSPSLSPPHPGPGLAAGGSTCPGCSFLGNSLSSAGDPGDGTERGEESSAAVRFVRP